MTQIAATSTEQLFWVAATVVTVARINTSRAVVAGPQSGPATTLRSMRGPRTRPVLISIGGLPATGKSTIARRVAGLLGAAYVRVDTIETAIGRSEGSHAATNQWLLPPGYVVGYDLAGEQLGLGLDVVAESVNAFAETRDAWREVATNGNARLIEVETVCTDPAEHRRRAEHRTVDIDDLTLPTWQEILDREYHPWTRDRLIIDTATIGVDDAVEAITEVVANGRP